MDNLKVKAIEDMISLLKMDYRQGPDIKTYLEIKMLEYMRHNEFRKK